MLQFLRFRMEIRKKNHQDSVALEQVVKSFVLVVLLDLARQSHS